MRKFKDLNEVKEALRKHVDIVEFISNYVQLEKKGKRYVGYCPFHDDKSNPGFSVTIDGKYNSKDSSVWGCWTCEAKGELFAFVERFHNCNFLESIELIAELTHFDLEPFYRELTQEEIQRERQYNAIESVANLFSEELFSSHERLNGFYQRGIYDAILRNFAVGYCPSLEFLKVHVSRDIIYLIESNVSQHLRLFGERILYAQSNDYGRCTGFYARQPENRGPEVPKYISTTRNIYLQSGDSSRFYGFRNAKKFIKRDKYNNSTILVEGFHDVLAGQQAEFPLVGLCGTKLNDDHVKTLIQHSIRDVIVYLDPDEGGYTGMYDIAKKAPAIPEIHFKFLCLPQEPEEFIKQEGKEKLQQSIEKDTISPIDFIVWYRTRFTNINLDLSASRIHFIDEMKEFLTAYPSKSLDRELGLEAISRITNLSKDSIDDYITEKSESSLINIQAQQTILAELLLNPQAWISYYFLTEQDFSLKRFKYIFNLMHYLYEQDGRVNVALLSMEAINQKATPEIMETISKLQGIKREDVEKLAHDIHDKAIRRQTIEFAETLKANIQNTKVPIGEILGNTMNSLTNALSERKNNKVLTNEEAVMFTIKEIERRNQITEGTAGINIGKDFDWLMNMTNGFQETKVYCLGAFLGVGKSVVGANWVHKIAVVGEHPGLWATMEMKSEDNIMRLLAIDSGIPSMYIQKSKFETQEQIEEVQNSIHKIQQARITWMSGQQTMRDIAMQARMLHAQGRLEWLLIDYIQLLDLSPYHHQWATREKYAQASQDIHDLAHSLNIPIIVLAQLNKESQKDDIPSKEHIAEAIKIAQDANVVYLLAPRQDGLLGILDKNRDGGEGVTKLSFDTNPQTSNLRVSEIEILKRMPK